MNLAVRAAVCALACSGAAQAADRIAFAIPAGSLRGAIVALGDRAGITIGIGDPTLGGLRVPGVRGRLTVPTALARLLAGSGATAVRGDAGTWRIVASPARPHPAPRLPRETAEPAAIVVTGSKRSAALADYPASVQRVDTSEIRPGALIHGSGALVEQVPILASTHLGPGRNKLFVRGIADSSFNGPTQAIVGQYLGEVRLNYDAPDPDLALIDIAAVEILEGPQGTLYGAGALGGIVRLMPAPPDPDRVSGSITAGGASSRYGGGSADGAIVANLPIIAGRLAIRAVAYGAIDGGYIDDPGRGLRDINRTTTHGGRVTLRFQPAADWTIDLGGVTQDINSRDGQYATRGLPPLQRRSTIAQPFDNDYSLVDLVVRHPIGATTLVSATSAVFHDVGTIFDASITTPIRFTEDDRIMLLTNETRLSRQTADGGGWVIGVQALHNDLRIRRTLGPPGNAPTIAGTRNTVDDLSLFGEATVPLSSHWFATAGGRIGYAHLVGRTIGGGVEGVEQRREEVSLLPSAGIVWKADRRLSLYARYQEGYRPGGLSVLEDGAAQRFEADSVATYEAGARWGGERDRLSASVAMSYAHWEDIQADLVAADGLPFTANIGSGRVLGVEAQARWRTRDGLTIEAAAFANDSSLARPAAAFAGERDASLPNIADLVARIAARYTVAIAGHAVTVSGSLGYVGKSRLGVGPALDLPQGRYCDTALGITAPIGRATLSLDASNLADARGNVFALGNPFSVLAGRQTTPLRPRTIRLGVGFAL